MKIMLDTNIIISAALFPRGSVAAAYMKALQYPYEPIVCDYIVDELHRKFEQKFPEQIIELEAFLYTSLSVIELVETPEEKNDAEKHIRDPKDRPILRAALNAHVDLFLTGDKDFLESSITEPRIVSVADFLALSQDK